MLIAFIVVACLLVVFVATTFFMTFKKYKFEVDNGNLKVQTLGSRLKIYFNDKIIKNVNSPQLFNGEEIDFKIGEKDYKLTCKCNKLGNKLRIEIYEGESLICDNGVELKK